jgi:hypothetical protein
MTAATPNDIVRRLRRLARQMITVGTDMDYYSIVT